jgi:hypothetical protein
MRRIVQHPRALPRLAVVSLALLLVTLTVHGVGAFLTANLVTVVLWGLSLLAIGTVLLASDDQSSHESERKLHTRTRWLVRRILGTIVLGVGIVLGLVPIFALIVDAIQ